MNCECGKPVPYDGGKEGVCECCSTCEATPTSGASQLLRVPAQEVVPGDRIGDGRFQGVQVVAVKFPVFERMAIGGIDPEIVRISLGSHGWLGCRKDQPVLVERAVKEAKDSRAHEHAWDGNWPDATPDPSANAPSQSGETP